MNIIVQIFIIYLTIAALVALFSNLFVLVIFFAHRKLRKNGCLYLIISLSAIDFLFGINRIADDRRSLSADLYR